MLKDAACFKKLSFYFVLLNVHDFYFQTFISNVLFSAIRLNKVQKVISKTSV